MTSTGPCPLPDPGWSDEVVAALMAQDGSLDEVDARIVMSLIERTMPGGVTTDVEAVVLRHLAQGFDMQLRQGHVDELSEVVDPSLPADAQTVIQFQMAFDPDIL